MTAEEWQFIRFTTEMAVVSTLLILPIGLALAWLLARRQWHDKALVETLVSLPLVLPPVVTGLLLLKLFGRRGRSVIGCRIGSGSKSSSLGRRWWWRWR